jgi:hypothetical protein
MTAETVTTYCANHPQVESNLRCNRCEKPICTRCAVLTPTGYRCKECVRGQQKVFDTAQWYDYPLAFALAALLAFLGSRLIPFLGFFTLFIAPIAGGIIAEVVRFVVRRRRSQRLFQISALATALGSSIYLLIYLAGFLLISTQGGGGLRGIFPLIWQAVYAFIVTSTVYYRLGGIRL